MIPLNEMILFVIAAFILVISPGPNMIYLISRSLAQGKKAGFISLLGVMCGFLFHIIMVSFGLTAVLLTVPYAYAIIKILGVVYLSWLAYQAVKPGGKSVFETRHDLKEDNAFKLLSIGFFTNVLNPKVAVFYLSFFPQFIKPAHGSVLTQSFQLGLTQMTVSFIINLIIILAASRAAVLFAENPLWTRMQKWLMAGILSGLAIKMALDKSK